MWSSRWTISRATKCSITWAQKPNSTCWACSKASGCRSAPRARRCRWPNMISLYRRPILDYWAEHDETLGTIVKHVLVHEIGHHFGFSDADMEAIEASVDDAEEAAR